MHPPDLPLTLSRLYDASDGAERDTAWAEFITAHSALVLHVCHSMARDHDAAMDGYAWVLEALREDGCRRLRAYVPDGKTKFTTWLVVVTRRLVLDYFRRRYGRPRSEDPAHRDEQATRRRLEDLVAEEIEPDQIESATHGPDRAVRRAQLMDALRRTIEELNSADRLLLALRFGDDRPIKDIARALGFPSVFHVYRRLGIVLSTLRRGLSSRGVVGPEP